MQSRRIVGTIVVVVVVVVIAKSRIPPSLEWIAPTFHHWICFSIFFLLLHFFKTALFRSCLLLLLPMMLIRYRWMRELWWVSCRYVITLWCGVRNGCVVYSFRKKNTVPYQIHTNGNPLVHPDSLSLLFCFFHILIFVFFKKKIYNIACADLMEEFTEIKYQKLDPTSTLKIANKVRVPTLRFFFFFCENGSVCCVSPQIVILIEQKSLTMNYRYFFLPFWFFLKTAQGLLWSCHCQSPKYPMCRCQRLVLRMSRRREHFPLQGIPRSSRRLYRQAHW